MPLAALRTSLNTSLGFLTAASLALIRLCLFSDLHQDVLLPVWLNAFHIFRPVLTIWDPRFLGAVAVIGVAGLVLLRLLRNS